MNVRYLISVLVLFSTACQENQKDSDNNTFIPDDITQAIIDTGNIDSLVTDIMEATLIGISAVVGPHITITEETSTTINGESYGCLLGESIFNLERVDESRVRGNSEYSDYDNCLYYTLNGVATIDGAMSGQRIEYFDFNFDDLSLLKTGLNSAQELVGNMRLEWKPSVAGSSEYTLTMNAYLNRSNNQNEFILENFIIDSNITAGQQHILIDGRIYITDIGYIDIDSNTPIVLDIPGQAFTSGQYTISGKSEIVTVSYASGNYTTEITIK